MVYGIIEKDRSQPRKDKGCFGDASPKSVKDIKKLTWRIVALNQFISKSTDKCLSYFRMLKGCSKFTWDENFQRAFDYLKSYFSSPPVGQLGNRRNIFFLYLATSNKTLAVVLVKEVPDEQSLIFYVNRALQTSKLNYSKIEKLAIAC